MTKYDIRTLLLLVALLALGFSAVRLIVTQVTTLSDNQVTFGCSGWRYTAEIYGLKGFLVESSELTWHNNPVPQSLLTGGRSLKTPIGNFSAVNGKWLPHFTDPHWRSDGYEPPCDINADFVKHDFPIDEALQQGFYRTPVKTVPISGTWDNRRLEGTPSEWVHVSIDGAGFWVDPSRLDELPLAPENSR